MVNSKKYDVVTVDWFKRITNQSDIASLDDFLPWELLSSRDATKRRLAHNFDEYYDSFIIDADEESLKRSFDKIVKSVIFHLKQHYHKKILHCRANLISLKFRLACRQSVHGRAGKRSGRGIVRWKYVAVLAVQGCHWIL